MSFALIFHSNSNHSKQNYRSYSKKEYKFLNFKYFYINAITRYYI